MVSIRLLPMSVSGEARIMGDRLMIRRAIGNLLSNALRHSPSEAVVAVTIEGKEGGATLCLTNSGPTIAPEVLPRLFDRFFRVDKSRSHPNSDGAGLGLSITQAIMAAHGGRVLVNSENGKTTFCLAFQGAAVMPSSPSG